jgi:hypothetical protein
MFGKPNWFKENQIGWGLKPITWQGWSYSVLWGSAIALPLLALLSSQKFPEALIWLTASAGLLVWDQRQILAAIKRNPDEELFVIVENETASGLLETRKYEMYVSN